MAATENNRKVIIALSIGLIFTLLAFYYGYIERFMPWWCQLAASMLIAITVIMMVVNLVKRVISVFKNRKELNANYFYPVVIYLTAILAPTGSWEAHLSPVKFRACYEGTQSQTTIEFREDHTFELHATGVFLYNDWMMGKWAKNGDTLKLKWNVQPAKTLGNTVLIDSGYLNPWENRQIPDLGSSNCFIWAIVKEKTKRSLAFFTFDVIKPATMNIRRATLADIPAIMSIVKEAVPLMQAAGNFQWNDTYPNPEAFADDIALNQLWVAEIDGLVAGASAITTEQYPEYAQAGLDITEPAIVTHRLVVSSHYRGQGIADALLMEAEYEAGRRNISLLRIDTNKENKAAQKLFIKLGYVFAGEIGLAFRPGMRFVCLEKKLT